VDLLTAWKNWLPTEVPYVLRQDEDILKHWTGNISQTWTEAYQAPDFGAPGDTRLHLGLLPHPYCGDLVNASIYVLMLNPGLGFQDYYGEYDVPAYRKHYFPTFGRNSSPQSRRSCF
jgi:hypothetical protein